MCVAVRLTLIKTTHTLLLYSLINLVNINVIVGMEVQFTLRVFSTSNVDLIPVSLSSTISISGRWRAKLSEIYTAGNALFEQQEELRF